MGAGPWNQEQIDAARTVRFSSVLDFLGAHHKVDTDYEPLDPAGVASASRCPTRAATSASS